MTLQPNQSQKVHQMLKDLLADYVKEGHDLQDLAFWTIYNWSDNRSQKERG